jgi:hypothetical protein
MSALGEKMKPESIAKMRLTLKGRVPWNKGLVQSQIPWNKGRTLSDEHRQNLAISHLGQIPWQKGRPLNEKQRTALLMANLGKKQSEETRRKRSISMRGKRMGTNSNFWKGGINPLRIIIRDLSEAAEWRKNVFKRDNFTCQSCGIRGTYLEAHHLKTFECIYREFLQEFKFLSPIHDKYRLVELSRKYSKFWDVSNGWTLCSECHEVTMSGPFKEG